MSRPQPLSSRKRPIRFASRLRRLAKIAASLVSDAVPESLAILLPVCIAIRHTQSSSVLENWWTQGATSSQQETLAIATQILAQPVVPNWLEPLKQQTLLCLASDETDIEAGELSPLERFVTYWFESFLAIHAAQDRKQAGVYFTPPAVAAFTIRHAGELLSPGSKTSWLDYFADPHSNSLGGLLLDPAVGSGIFLAEVVRQAHAQFASLESGHSAGDWQVFVSNRLLPGLKGLELLADSACLARLNVGLALQKSGLQLDHITWQGIEVQNSLLVPPTLPTSKRLAIVGNPPFVSFSVNQGEWITRLVRGTAEVPGYLRRGDKVLGERKTWLHDDYVKFFRLAQWLVEGQGSGLVAFVSNHGFLDNVTFRLMREELLRVFPCIDIVDLHGNRKQPLKVDQGKDENIFGLDQGIAITFLHCSQSDSPQVKKLLRRADLVGTAESKTQTLATTWASDLLRRLEIESDGAAWASSNDNSVRIISSGLTIADLFSFQATAPVTARDRLVVGFTPAEVLANIQAFADPSLTDDDLRNRYFGKVRTSRYLRGDTRSWKLPAARELVRQHGANAAVVQSVWYRPWDLRYVYWDSRWIDWPRTQLTQWLSQPNSLALITRRQIPHSSAGNFFWVTDRLTLDGIIRSDNRGGESVFPLWLGSSCNLRPQVASQLLSCFGETYSESNQSPYGPKAILGYLYALVHSHPYQQKISQASILNFPPLFYPRNQALFEAMSKRGLELMGLHLTPPSEAQQIMPVNLGDRSNVSPESIQAFQVGSYPIQTLHQKRLRQMHASPEQAQSHRASIQRLVAASISLQQEVSALLTSHGGMDSLHLPT